jgi:hypothetical protein
MVICSSSIFRVEKEKRQYPPENKCRDEVRIGVEQIANIRKAYETVGTITHRNSTR